MSGLELLQAIRREGLRVQFGFITSEASATVRHDAAEAGALFLVTKPFTPEILQKTLAAALSAVG
jgi:two-component system, chemotaxis family, chemotaxis protein CheY